MELPTSGNLTDDVVGNARDHADTEVFSRPGPGGWVGVTAVRFHDEVPVVRERVQPQLEEGQHLLGARDDRELLGGHRVHPGGVDDGQEIALDLGPGLLEAQLRVDLLDEEVVGDARRLGADRRTERIGQGVRGVGRQHECAVAGGRGQRSRTRGHGRLADPALAGEEENPQGPTRATRRASSAP